MRLPAVLLRQFLRALDLGFAHRLIWVYENNCPQSAHGISDASFGFQFISERQRRIYDCSPMTSHERQSLLAVHWSLVAALGTLAQVHLADNRVMSSGAPSIGIVSVREAHDSFSVKRPEPMPVSGRILRCVFFNEAGTGSEGLLMREDILA